MPGGYIGLSRTFARTNMASYAFWGVVAVVGTVATSYVDQNERDRCDRFRDKSKMFGGHVKEGEAPSWGNPYKPII